jgi:hypothetical protein
VLLDMADAGRDPSPWEAMRVRFENLAVSEYGLRWPDDESFIVVDAATLAPPELIVHPDLHDWGIEISVGQEFEALQGIMVAALFDGWMLYPMGEDDLTLR